METAICYCFNESNSGKLTKEALSYNKEIIFLKDSLYYIVILVVIAGTSVSLKKLFFSIKCLT